MMEFRHHLKSLILPISGVLILSGAAAGVMYYYLYKDDDDEGKGKAQSSVGGCGNTAVSVQVPKEVIGLVIGRQGSNIKLIQQSTNTTINFTNKEKDGVRECVIKGTPDNIKTAQELIIKVINNQPILETEELEVPNMAVNRIIGRNGNTVRSISLSTGAKITVGKEHQQQQQQQDLNNSSIEGDGLAARKVFITGTKEQIQAAKTQLLEKVLEEEKYREELSASVANMSLRSRGKQLVQDREEISLDERFASLASDDKVIEAYVSAVDSATHFWIQVVGPRSIELDKLLREMTEFYSNHENREVHQLEEACVDSIVAAKFPHDDYWYRAKVCACASTSDHTPQSKVTVYYVDFGDTETVPLDDVCELRTDFLRLSFQAIECYLANVDPESAKSDESADVFEELTHASQWKPVRVQVLGYREQEPTTTTTTTTTITPYVQITNISGPVDFDVAEELVKRGLGSFCKNSTESEC